MPQFDNLKNKVPNYKNIALGFFIFSLGLFKKVLIADTFAVWASNGFDKAEILSLIEAWATSLSYTFQLYFDFSGYCDMAIGAALLFNIKLPINFNSPYKASDIQDFWRRWHITLSRFLRDYVYIPLGGNRKGRARTYLNLMLTFIIGGIWHGAGWTFIFWGFLHGLALMIHRFWHNLGFRMNKVLAWFITFNFVNIAWVFFRAKDWSDAIKVLKGMCGMSGVVLPDPLRHIFKFLQHFNVEFGGYLIHIGGRRDSIIWLLVGFILILCCKNSMQLLNSRKVEKFYIVAVAFLLLAALSNLNTVSEFLYFNF